MARLARLTVPGHPHHVIQRGNNRQPIFHDDTDRERLLQLIVEHAAQHKVALHAYVLMGNHFHLLLTPESADAIPAMMQSVGRRYVQHFNRRHGRSGTLWEGRYKATLIQSERYLLACMAYLDLNPVRAGLVAHPADWSWSTYPHYAGLQANRRVVPHPLYWQLGNTPFAREAAYVELVRQGIAADQQKVLTDSALKGWALGDPDFVAGLQRNTSRRLQRRKAGRPAGKPARKS